MRFICFFKRVRYRSVLLTSLFLFSACFSKSGIENLPEITFSASPGPSASNVPVNTQFQLFFASPLDQGTISPGLFYLLDPNGITVPAKLNYAAIPDGTSVLTLTPLSYAASPPGYLSIGSYYTVVVGAGIKSLAGDSMTFFHTWSIQTNNSTDFIPPTFGGVISAEGLDMGSIRLTWGPASDNPGGSDVDQLVFSICYSINPINCQVRFLPVISNPPATRDSNGNYSFVIKPLRAATTYYFVVRVQDQAGNQDTNTVSVTASTKRGKLYVANFLNNNILGLDNPSALSATIDEKVRRITASQNGLVDPYGMAYDQKNDRLYVAVCQTITVQTLIESLPRTNCLQNRIETSKIAIYDQFSKLAGGDLKPTWTLVNPLPTVHLSGPLGLFLDNSGFNDTLFVANYSGKIAIYTSVQSSCVGQLNVADGTCALTPQFEFTSPDLVSPFGIAFDPTNQLLYVSNYIQVFQTVDSSTGVASPPVAGNTIAVFGFNQFGPNQHSYPALKTIGGPNQFNSPAGLWFDPPSDTLYIANAGPVYALPGDFTHTQYPGIAAICHPGLIPNADISHPDPQPVPPFTSCVDGNSQPQAAAQYLTGPNTGLLWPVQIAVSSALNSTTPSLYVSDYNGNKISIFSPNPLFSTSTAAYNTSPPIEEIYGLNNEVRKPVGIAVMTDSSQVDNLYVSNLGWDRVLLFNQVQTPGNTSQCNTSSQPYQCFFPAAKSISPAIFGPAGIYLNYAPDANGNPLDRLYVTSFYNNSVAVLDGVSGLNGNAYSSIYKLVNSNYLNYPFGIYVDTSQGKESVYVVNSRPDSNGKYSVVVFDLLKCPVNANPADPACNLDSVVNGTRVIQSDDLVNPAGIWVDQGVDSNNQPRDLLLVANRGASSVTSPGFISIFKNSSTASGSVSAYRLIQGDQTSLYIPTGLYMDPKSDQLYVANQGYNDILVFNQPQNCTPQSLGSNVCNILSDRTIYNTADIVHSFDGPSSLVIDYSADQIYMANVGLYNHLSSLYVLSQASTLNGQAFVSNAYMENVGDVETFPLNFPESLALDITR